MKVWRKIIIAALSQYDTKNKLHQTRNILIDSGDSAEWPEVKNIYVIKNYNCSCIIIIIII